MSKPDATRDQRHSTVISTRRREEGGGGRQRHCRHATVWARENRGANWPCGGNRRNVAGATLTEPAERHLENTCRRTASACRSRPVCNAPARSTLHMCPRCNGRMGIVDRCPCGKGALPREAASPRWSLEDMPGAAWYRRDRCLAGAAAEGMAVVDTVVCSGPAPGSPFGSRPRGRQPTPPPQAP